MLRGGFFVGLLGGALTLTGVGSAADEAARCKKATKGDSPIAKACAAGGLKEAKKVMKDLTKKAKAAGVKFDCDDCHKDDTAYDQLSDDANDKFKKMLAAVEGKK